MNISLRLKRDQAIHLQKKTTSSTEALQAWPTKEKKGMVMAKNGNDKKW